MKLFNKVKDWIRLPDNKVVRAYKKVLVVVDTSAFLNEEAAKEIGLLLRLKNLYVPMGVYGEIQKKLKDISLGKIERSLAERVNVISIVLEKMLKRGKWRLESSRELGIVPNLRKIEIFQLEGVFQDKIWSLVKKRMPRTYIPIEGNRYQTYNNCTTLEELVGIGDLRVIAVALKLQRQKKNRVVLLTRDKMMTLVAESQGLSVIESLKNYQQD